jgi:3',5'-cyclic AMP phosphodiesterase CpdA
MSFIVAQISDTHVSDRVRADGRRPDEALQRALELAGEERVALILITGDLVADAKPAEYAVLRAILQGAPAPVFLMPGNHDDRDEIRRAFPEHAYLPTTGKLHYVVDEGPIRLAALDCIVPEQVHGEFSAEDLHWLDARLGEAAQRPTIVALHHPPFPTQDHVFDTICLRRPEPFAEVVARHPQVERVLCGHYHRATVARFGRTMGVIAPSTAWAFQISLGENAPPVLRQKQQPLGFALHIWGGDLGFTTHFVWL